MALSALLGLGGVALFFYKLIEKFGQRAASKTARQTILEEKLEEKKEEQAQPLPSRKAEPEKKMPQVVFWFVILLALSSTVAPLFFSSDTAEKPSLVLTNFVGSITALFGLWMVMDKVSIWPTRGYGAILLSGAVLIPTYIYVRREPTPIDEGGVSSTPPASLDRTAKPPLQAPQEGKRETIATLPSNAAATVERKLAGESFHIPVAFKPSNEKFGMAIGGPQHIRLQTDKNHFIKITEGVGKYTSAPASSAQAVARRLGANKITIADKYFYKRSLYLFRDGEYLGTCAREIGTYQLNSQGHVINISTGEIKDKNPRPLTEYIFDLGNNIFSIGFEDKIPNHESLIKTFLGLNESAATKKSITQSKKGASKDEVKKIAIYNLSNGGHMLQRGKDVYYSKWDGILYKTEVGRDDADRIAIYSNENGRQLKGINIDGDTLYFYADGKGICRIKTNGEGFELIESFSDFNKHFYLKQMILSEGILFVNGAGELYRVHKDTGNKRKISNEGQEIAWITAYNGFLYAIVKDDFNDGSVMRTKINPNATKWETVIKNLNADSMLIDDDFIYYFKSYDASISQLKHDGTGKKKISADRGDRYFSMNSKWVFFRNGWGIFGGNTTIEAFDKTNSANETEELASGDINDSFGIYIIGDYLYYVDGSALSKKPL